MTRKDYVLIAEVFAHFGQMIELDETIGADLAYEFADRFQQDNPRFDRERFLIASGVWKKCDHCKNRATAFGTNHQWCAIHKGRGLVKNWTPEWALNN
jgi:hypothetical protein